MSAIQVKPTQHIQSPPRRFTTLPTDYWSLQQLLFVTIRTGSRPGIFHGMACFAEPVGHILAKAFYATRHFTCFSVTLLAIALQVGLVFFMRKGDSVLESEGLGVISGR
jgi:hypothetical protein